jgi:hypothetical protein
LISPESRPLFDCGYLNGRLGNFEFLGFLILTEPEKGLPEIAKVKCGIMASGNVNRAKRANFQPGASPARVSRPEASKGDQYAAFGRHPDGQPLRRSAHTDAGQRIDCRGGQTQMAKILAHAATLS